MARVLRSYSDLAAPFEVRIALEPRVNAHSAVRTLGAAQEVVQGLNRGNVGLAFGIESLRESGAKPEDLGALDVKKLWLVRLESAPPQSPPEAGGEAAAPSSVNRRPMSLSAAVGGDSWEGGHFERQQAICKRLADKGYRGPYCIQWPAPAPADGHSEDAMVGRARQARQAALEMLTPLYP
jgi:hypothetical protein